MTTVTAVLSMLHEPAGRHSATRLFRDEPVLSWTLDRLSRAKRLDHMAIICWDDQVEAVRPLAEEAGAHVLCKSPRTPIPQIAAIAAAQRWSDGWRGGLMGTCDFDNGFFAPYVVEILDELSSDTALLADPASGLIDFAIVDRVIEQSQNKPDPELFFTQSAPGLAGVLLRRTLLDRLCAARKHPGLVLAYLPDQPIRDPISTEGCVLVPTSMARTTHRFKLDSNRQIDRITHSSVSLNGQLITAGAEDLLQRITAHDSSDPMPREIVLELTTRRQTKPIFSPATHLAVNRPDLSLGQASRLFDQLADVDDLRLSLAGTGDALLHGELFPVIEAARDRGIRAIQIETDLLAATETIDRLAESCVDIVSFHLPAMTPQTYRSVMGIDAMQQVLENVQQFLVRRQTRQIGTPLLVPLFTKCVVNLPEMEAWYDQWLRALSAAVIVGPSCFASQLPVIGVSDMAPSRRTGCSRIRSRMTVLCDGSIAACENDCLGARPLGHIDRDAIADVWKRGFEELRADHQRGCWDKHALCKGCKDWHRP